MYFYCLLNSHIFLICEHAYLFTVIPFHSHTLYVNVLNGLNYSEWHEQVQFHLGVMDLDFALLNDKPTAINDKSSEDEKSFHKMGVL